MDWDIFENTPHVNVNVFYTDKNDAFSKYPDTCGCGHDVGRLTLYLAEFPMQNQDFVTMLQNSVGMVYVEKRNPKLIYQTIVKIQAEFSTTE